MKKVFGLFTFCFISLVCIAQVEEEIQIKEKIVISDLTVDDKEHPRFILLINEVEYVLDEFESLDLESDHIESIEVLKGKKDLERYNTTVGVLFITPKKRYEKFYLKKLEAMATEKQE